MQRRSAMVRQLFHYKEQLDPLEGDALNKAMRDTAYETISDIFSEENKAGGELRHGFGPRSKVFKNHSSLLKKLIKHKHGWVFNAPVDIKAIGLTDYCAIIKHPMDLGTVKSRLNKNWYKSQGKGEFNGGEKPKS
ncbi:hypothetical protein Pint_31798 [Pistacia integerrima]|uniref:Uncharacterized protein n=1 Tax=Pistacia integerrima TaxID=434235 RepID=A0ACC0XNJ0_9ROSI|nr:hypothetical protein Pint_31798 [Pistacia integerrima]